MSDDPVDSLIRSAECHLAEAETLACAGDHAAAAAAVEDAVNELLRAGSRLTAAIHPEDMAELEGTAARVLRALAERFGILPENYLPVFSVAPEAEKILNPATAAEAQEHQSVAGVARVVSQVYDTGASPDTELSEEEGAGYVSVLGVLIELLQGQRTLTDAVFADGGAYDAFAGVAAPYLITGAAYAAGDADTGTYEEKISEMLAGPVKRLIRLLAALLTSAFMSGLILLLIRRILAVRHLRPGIIENAMFAGSVLSLIAANIPMFIDGSRAVIRELRELQNIIDRDAAAADIPVE